MITVFWCELSLRATYGAFPLRGTTRLGTVQNGTARLCSARFAFPLQFSTALEWVGIFMCRYICAASAAVTPENVLIRRHSITLSLDPLHGYQREEQLYFLNRPRNNHFFGC